MQDFGYLIVRDPREIQREFLASHVARTWPDLLASLRDCGSFLDPFCYRGISRDPLQPLPSNREEMLEAFRKASVDVDSNRRACLRFLQLREERPLEDPDDSDYDLLDRLNDAQEISSLTDDPGQHEIISLRRRRFSPSELTLGYDIGYWGGDHFSLIADSFVAPTWHPPDPQDFAELVEHLRPLNHHLLFDSPTAAEEFTRYYKSKVWVETEQYDGEFCVIQVDTVPRTDA